MPRVCVLAVALLAALASAQLTAIVFPNAAFAPLSAATTTTVPSASLAGLSVADFTSVRLTGTVTPAVTDAALNFSAVSEGGVRLWIDDYLVISAGGLHNATAGGGATGAGRGAIQTIPVTRGVPLAFRLEYSRWSGPAAPPTLELSWEGASTPLSVVPPSAYSPTSSPAQLAMAGLRDSLAAPPACPWQTYYRKSAAGHTLAPTGLVVLASLVDVVAGKVLSDIYVQRGGSSYVSRAGLRSRNGSDYTQFAVWAWNGLSCNVSMETTVVPTPTTTSQLQFLATATGADCGRMRLLIQPTFFDERVGFPANASGSTGGFVVALPGFPSVTVAPAGAAPVPLNASVAPSGGTPYFALPLSPTGGGAGSATVGYCATPGAASPLCPPLADMVANVAAARARAGAVSPALYGNLSDVYDGIATSALWSTVYCPEEGVVAIVSRDNNWAGNAEFVADYVLFEWDSYFIALQAAVEEGMLRDIGVSTLVQVTLARTPRGFVPNWKSGSHSSNDRSENQVGALVAARVAGMLAPETRSWVVDLLFPPLLTWHEWVWSSRTAVGGVFWGEPLMVIASDPSLPHDHGDGTMQGARYESMDNSAAYDAPPVIFNTTTHQIEQYDVSPTALFLSDTEALMDLAVQAGRGDVLPVLQARFNATAAALNARLWLPQVGAYANRLFNGSFNPRLSPTSFYPLLSGVVSDDAAASLADLLASPAGFCVNATHTPGVPAPGATLPTTGLLTRWSSRATGHSVGCVTEACTDPVLLYGRASFEGVEASVPLTPAPGGASLRLNLYLSVPAGGGGNVTALATAPPDASFSLLSQEGWCFAPGDTPSPTAFRPWPTTNLTLWARAASHDFRTCGTAACEAGAAGAGYVLAGGEGGGPSMCLAFDASTVETLPCLVPTPSIARADASFIDQNYWRGRGWAPQALLVYLGVKRYAARVPALQAALADLVALGKATMLREWLSFGHIAENLSGLTGFSQDSGDSDPAYAWGGCFGLPAILEAGHPRGGRR